MSLSSTSFLGLCYTSLEALGFLFKIGGSQPRVVEDVAFLLTIGSFLLTVELFYLQLTILALLLTI